MGKTRIIIILTAFLLLANSAFAEMSAGDWDKLRENAATGSASALTQIQNGAQTGDATAEFELAQLFYNGQDAQQYYAQAAEWCRKAAEQGNAEEQNNLAACRA